VITSFTLPVSTKVNSAGAETNVQAGAKTYGQTDNTTCGHTRKLVTDKKIYMQMDG